MNERTKLLASKALDKAVPETWTTLTPYDLTKFTEVFAELIVKECAELSVNSQYVNTKSEYYEGFNEALVYAGNKIKKHFGVEE